MGDLARARLLDTHLPQVMPETFHPTPTTTSFERSSSGWFETRCLKADPDGPTIIFHAAVRHGFQFISNPFPRFCSAPFFFVSTEMTGCCRACAAMTFELMYSNWASRSGCFKPSSALRLDWREKPEFHQLFAHGIGTDRMPHLRQSRRQLLPCFSMPRSKAAWGRPTSRVRTRRFRHGD